MPKKLKLMGPCSRSPGFNSPGFWGPGFWGPGLWDPGISGNLLKREF